MLNFELLIVEYKISRIIPEGNILEITAFLALNHKPGMSLWQNINCWRVIASRALIFIV